MKFLKFHSNRIIYLILIFLSLTFISNVKAIVSPTINFYVNDYANIIDSETEEYILNKSVALNNVDGTQIVVVTVPSLDGMSLEDYSLELFRSFGIGDEEKNNGLLILIAKEERLSRIEVGYGLEGILPDGKTGRFQDIYMIPYFKEDNFSEGIRNGYDAFYSEIVKLNNLDLEYTNPKSTNNSELFGITILGIFSGIVLGVISRYTKKRDKFSLVYGIVFLILFFLLPNYFGALITNLFAYFFTAYASIDMLYFFTFFGGRGSGGGFNGTSGGFSGGGGSTLGGGSSRHF